MRITENSTRNTIQDTLQNSRQRMDKLQRQNATLKRINKPSDDPVGNLRLMRIRDDMLNNEQFSKNASLARNFLSYTDHALGEALEIVNRAKELSIQMASSAANGPESRAMVAEEIRGLRDQLSAVANKRLGERYLFGGFKTLTQPFDNGGKYYGDNGQMAIEVSKDIFVNMNLAGSEVFLGKSLSSAIPKNADEAAGISTKNPEESAGRDPAMEVSPELVVENPNPNMDQPTLQQGFLADGDLFRMLDGLNNALVTNNVEQIQGLLEPMDKIVNRIIQLRAQVSSRVNGINAAENSSQVKAVSDAELQSKTEDADLIEVVSGIAREENVLKASMQASQHLVQPNLLDFLR